MSHAEETTRCRLLESAGAVFAEHGFEKATIREISSLASVNVGAINYHFGSKENLYTEAYLHAHKVVFEQVPLPEWAEDTPPQQKLSDYISTMMKRILLARSLPWQARLMMREYTEPSEACRALSDQYAKPLHGLLVDILRELCPEGISEDKLQKHSFSIVGQVMFYKMHVPIMKTLISEDELEAHFSPDQIADHITEFSLTALGQELLSAKSE